MKYFLWILIVIISGSCTSQNTSKTAAVEPGIYPYKDHYVDLENLQKVSKITDSTLNFKLNGKYVNRLSFPAWFDGYPVKAKYKNTDFEIVANNTITIHGKRDGKEFRQTKTENDGSLDNVSGNNFLVTTTHGVVHVKRIDGKSGYVIRKYDENGNEVFKTDFEHTHIDVSIYQQTYYPYLYYFEHTDNSMVFTSNDMHYPKTVALDLISGKLTAYEYTVNGIIRSEDERNLSGFVLIHEEKQKITVKNDSTEWTVNMDNNYYDRAETLLIGSVLVICTFPNIATGSALAAYDFKTGKLMWKADVKQLNVGHSKYYNAVNISLYKDKIIMEGKEAYGGYLQIFDLSNGKRFYAEGDFVD